MARWRHRRSPCPYPLSLSLRQRNVLAVVAQNVEDLHPIRGNPDYFISSIYDVALCRNKNIFILDEKNSFRSIQPVACKSIKLEIARWRGWRWRRTLILRVLGIGVQRALVLRNRHHGRYTGPLRAL